MLQAFTVLDKAVMAFGAPFFVRAKGEAIRMFNDSVNDKQSPFFKHPADFALYSIGEFDPTNGSLVARPTELIVTALDVLQAM